MFNNSQRHMCSMCVANVWNMRFPPCGHKTEKTQQDGDPSGYWTTLLLELLLHRLTEKASYMLRGLARPLHVNAKTAKEHRQRVAKILQQLENLLLRMRPLRLHLAPCLSPSSFARAFSTQKENLVRCTSDLASKGCQNRPKSCES